MSIAIYYTHEAVCLFTNAKNISFERKSSNAECGTFTLAVLAATVRWEKFRTSASTRRCVRDKLSHIGESMAAHLKTLEY